MAQRVSRTPSEPGADLLDDAIGRLRAMKTTVGLVLARALEAAHSRFLVFGSTLAVLASKVEDLEKRDNINWPALDRRLEAAEARLTDIESVCNGEVQARISITSDARRRLEALEVFRDGGDPGNLGAEGLLEALEKRVGDIESGALAAAEWRSNVLKRLETAENGLTDELIRLGLSARSEQANAQATRALLRAALAVLDPPLSARDILSTTPRRAGT